MEVFAPTVEEFVSIPSSLVAKVYEAIVEVCEAYPEHVDFEVVDGVFSELVEVVLEREILIIVAKGGNRVTLKSPSKRDEIVDLISIWENFLLRSC